MNLLDMVQRYWNTLRYLKPVQLYGRLWFRLHRPRLDPVAAPTLREAAGHWQVPASRSANMLGPATFRFLNHEHGLPEQGGWNDAALEKLWLYNLHYFDDLNAKGASGRLAWHRDLIERWVAENPPTAGNGWEPYPTSLRIVNWVKWELAGNRLPAAALPSLTLQARWLTRRLEWHLLGNHLFANAKALVMAGLFFDGAEANDWLEKGLKIIAAQLPEQVLPDGGHFERSPMYHALFLEDLLDLVNAAGQWPMRVPAATQDDWRETASRMLGWLKTMTHPDGELALFNDAASGIAPDLAALQAYAVRLGIGPVVSGRALDCGEARLTELPDSGYLRLEQPGAVALLDVAPVGPDYLPGHAHADTLSFELSVAGQRVVVNGGTSCYGTSAQRLRERGTAAHSTVQVAGQDSSEVWGGFRVARRARPFGKAVSAKGGVLEVGCSHDGYRRLPGQPVHRRTWRMDRSSLQVSDAVQGGSHGAVARFLLHPGIHVQGGKQGHWVLSNPGVGDVTASVEHGMASLEPAGYAPEFGMVLPTSCLAVDMPAGQAVTRFEWG